MPILLERCGLGFQRGDAAVGVVARRRGERPIHAEQARELLNVLPLCFERARRLRKIVGGRIGTEFVVEAERETAHRSGRLRGCDYVVISYDRLRIR
jgi:hypothetical protein